MKKKNIINLVKYHAEKNDLGFRNEAYEIAKYFDETGDHQLAEYIMALLSDANTFVPQLNEEQTPYSNFLEKIDTTNDTVLLSDAIKDDIIGIINAIKRGVGINKFMFKGVPGTGKTETAKQVARILNRDIYLVDFPKIIDSKLGQTQKNIASLFQEINRFPFPEKTIILFDEIDSIALDRTNANDIREMGRATSTILKELDRLNSQIVLIATTNLFDHFDKAIIRRFDSIVDFNRYSNEDLIEISEIFLNIYLKKFACSGKNIRLFRKIMSLFSPLPYPGDLKNIIRNSVAFSAPLDEFDYLRRLYYSASGERNPSPKDLKTKGFTVREIELLTGISKSQVARKLKTGLGHE